MSGSEDGNTERLQEMLYESRYPIAITGAGISVAAGIPDFGHLHLKDSMQIASEKLLKNAPERYYAAVQKTFLKAMFMNGPTFSHKKLARLEREQVLRGVITTNIDCLHTIAGSENVAELQGSFAVNECLQCGRRYDDYSIWNEGCAPRCCCAPRCSCGGVIAPFPVYRHIGLDEDAARKARQWVMRADLILIIGSNGSYAGAYFHSIGENAKIVQINPKSTPFDVLAVMNIRKTADEVFAEIY